VPEKRLSPGASYSAGNANFVVEDCLEGDETVCRVALISSECPLPSAPTSFCEQSIDSTDDIAGGGKGRYFRYFIYNEDFGITAYGRGMHERPRDKDGRLRIAADMVLKGERGLLAP
jgi:hypothetical protein